MRARKKPVEASQDITHSTLNQGYMTNPGMSVDAQEDYMISLAVSEAEYQIRNHTASSQVITHYLKLGSTKERQEKEKMKEEIKLLRAKTAELEAAKERENYYKEAIKAFGIYSGQTVEEDSEDEYEQY